MRSCNYTLLKFLLGESWCLGIWAILDPSIGFPETFLFSMVPVPDKSIPYAPCTCPITKYETPPPLLALPCPLSR